MKSYGLPDQIVANQAGSDWVHDQIFGDILRKRKRAQKRVPAQPVTTSDSELIDKACKASARFESLYRSGWQDDDQSAQDFWLVSRLCFWFACDFARVDRAFKASALYRRKWDRVGARTIERAIAECTETYGGRRSGDRLTPPRSTRAQSDKLTRTTKTGERMDKENGSGSFGIHSKPPEKLPPSPDFDECVIPSASAEEITNGIDALKVHSRPHEKSERRPGKTRAIGSAQGSKKDKENEPEAELKTKKPALTEALLPFQLLGYDSENRHYFMQNYTDTVQAIAASKLSDISVLRALHPDRFEFWQRYFPAESGKSDWTDTARAQVWLINRSGARGIFDPKRVRGRGFWKDGDRIILHAGNALVIGNRCMRPNKWRGHFIYNAGILLPFDFKKQLSDSHAKEILKIFQDYKWRDTIMGTLAAGWATIAPFCGVLDWRPHLWLLTDPEVGKTTFVERIIVPLLANFHYLAQGTTTEAGIRQDVKLDALPVVIDEIDQEKKGAADRIRGVVGLMRASSSGKAPISKGSSSGIPQRFGLHSPYFLASVNSKVERQADETRISVLNFSKFTDLKAWNELSTRITKFITLDTGQRLIARTFYLLATIRKNLETFNVALTDHFNSGRTAQQVAPMLAGAYSLNSPQVIELEKAVEWIKSQDWGDTVIPSDAKVSEPERLIHYLNGWLIKGIPGSDNRSCQSTVGELIELSRGHHMEPVASDVADRTLRQHGIRARRNSVCVANRNPQISHYLEGTDWEVWHELLKRHPGAVPTGPIGGFGRMVEIFDWPKAVTFEPENDED